MEELVKPTSKDKISIHKQAEQRKEEKLIGRIRPKRGHILFEINLMEKSITKAKFEKQTITLEQAKDKHKTPGKKIMINPNCVYISALNEKNAFKKLQKK